MRTITIPAERLLEAELRAKLAPLCAHMGLYLAAIGDITARAINSGRFEIDQGGALTERVSVTDWLEDLKADPTASHLFSPDPSRDTRRVADHRNPTYGGFTKAEFDKLSPERKLAVANEVEARKRTS